jgi:hypothetical protein
VLVLSSSPRFARVAFLSRAAKAGQPRCLCPRGLNVANEVDQSDLGRRRHLEAQWVRSEFVLFSSARGYVIVDADQSDQPPAVDQAASRSVKSQSIDWYSEGESRIVEVDGVRVMVRFVGRHGRRGRIAITAPAGATFR